MNIAAGERITKLFAVYHPNHSDPAVFNAYSEDGPIILKPNNDPFPNISLKDATIIKIMEYPKPFPIPSKNDFQGLFDIA